MPGLLAWQSGLASIKKPNNLRRVNLNMQPPGEENIIEITLDEGQVLQTLLHHGSMSRTELARAMDCSRAKAGTVVNDLITRGILADLDDEQKTRSRLVNLNPGFGYIAGIDVGTTSLDVGLASLTGHVLARYSIDSVVEDGAVKVLSHAVDFLKQALNDQGVEIDQLRGIGVGLPGPVNFPSCVVYGEHFLPGWEGLAVQEFLHPVFPNATIMVDNDANVMALGSQRRGLGRDYSNFIYVKIGTGIGAGVVIRGHLMRGATSCSGHIGHTCVDFNGPFCRCGNQGCLEAMAGGRAVAKLGMDAVANGKSKLLAQRMEENGGMLTSKDVGDMAAKGDSASLSIFHEIGRMIGYVLAGAANTVNPELIVVGGGVSHSGYQMLTSIRRAILKRSYPFVTVNLPVRYSPIIDDVGVYGCIALATNWLFRVEGESLETLRSW